MKRLRKPIKQQSVYYCKKCGEKLKPEIYCTWFDLKSGEKQAQFLFKCSKSGMFIILKGLWFSSHTCIKVDTDGGIIVLKSK